MSTRFRMSVQIPGNELRCIVADKKAFAGDQNNEVESNCDFNAKALRGRLLTAGQPWTSPQLLLLFESSQWLHQDQTNFHRSWYASVYDHRWVPLTPLVRSDHWRTKEYAHPSKIQLYDTKANWYDMNQLKCATRKTSEAEPTPTEGQVLVDVYSA